MESKSLIVTLRFNTSQPRLSVKAIARLLNLTEYHVNKICNAAIHETY